ncbi:sugar ABC transporter transmembrane protein [Nitratireductor aquibiodomus RA22]|uniref:Sugar ABC transporter transmembrane protein n=1 Tax=Nitratireductor aquibiodomus RA22 TaxID=1189611 RepID=I5BS81_9HYPH|nr:carbohydrate ABC transporter permease [Nitratireductor aquibiodomus]EIM72433.1 sugar ABC transporter transmembrane protein [Nitratireductor aquibiodomus RA22]
MAQPIGSSTASNILHTAALVLLGMVVLFPVYWMVVIALTPTGFSRSLAGIVPEQITFENFTTLFTERPMLRWIGNSIFVAAASSFLSLAFGASCGYALSRIKFRGSGLVLILVLATQMMPATSIVVPLYILFRDFGLLDTMQGMVLGHISLVAPLAIWMSKGFFDSIPADLEGAARIDGCSRLSAYWHVTLPLALPGLAAIFIYGFVTSWHDFLFAKTLINSQSLWTAATGISSFRGEYFTLHELQMAAALVFALPVIVVFLIMQRRIAVSGALAGSVR